MVMKWMATMVMMEEEMVMMEEIKVEKLKDNLLYKRSDSLYALELWRVVAIVIYCDFPITKKIKINVQPSIDDKGSNQKRI